jgi:hypothetical protein
VSSMSLHATLHANLEICVNLAIYEKRKSLFLLFLGFPTILTRWKSQVRILCRPIAVRNVRVPSLQAILRKKTAPKQSTCRNRLAPPGSWRRGRIARTRRGFPLKRPT